MNHLNGKPLQVVLIDDNEQHLDLLTKLLNGSSGTACCTNCFKVACFTDPTEAIAQLPVNEPVVICCDYKMPTGNGLQWLPDLVKTDVGPVIIITSSGDEKIAAQAFKAGAADYITKEQAVNTPDVLRHAICDVLRRFNLQKRNRELAKELKLVNSEQAEKNELLRELTDTAHQFVENVAHEFRTPLTVIKEFASIINDGIGGHVTDDQKQYLKHIDTAATDLAQLVDDFLDSSKLKSQTLRVDRTAYTVTELFERVRPTLKTRAALKNITITEKIAPGLPTIYCDIEKAQRIIINLVVNAIKFSDENSEIILAADTDEKHHVRIAVTDRGPGLQPEEVNIIFERFKQVGDVQKSSAKGFGLGLNIAKELIWLNLGSVDVQSKPGHGSTFSFTIPPDNPHLVIPQFIKQIRQGTDDSHIAALAVTCHDPDTPNEDLRTLLAAINYPMDLVLQTDDRYTCYIVGATNDTERWLTRITDALAEHSREQTSEKRLKLSIRKMGYWPVSENDNVIITSLTNPILQGEKCA